MSEIERWQRIDELFHQAIEQPEPAQRAFIATAAGGDEGIAREVVALVDAHQRTHRLLDAPAVSQLPRGLRLGPYAIERVIGAGGMATVYLASRADRQFDKRVAIKLVNQGFAAELSDDRFQTERQVQARLDHPNIARLIDAGFSEFGQPYLVMEWVDGVPMDAWVARTQPSMDQRFDLFLAIASAVSYAHRNLVVHRDLKPSNVLVDRNGVVKLVDFGIAKLIGESAATSGATRTLRYTPLYASPEQIQGQPATTTADVYSLGVLLFELVSGTHPFRRPGQSPHEQAQAVLTGDVVVPPAVPADLAAILRKALRKEPDRRYATADQLAEDIGRYRRGWPVRAQPESKVYQLRKFVERHRLGVGVAAGVTVALIALTAVALWQARVATEQRARAEEVTDYITGFLGATPTGADWALRDRGAGMRVVELADLIAKRLEGSTAMHPDTEATLRYVLGMVYVQMGRLEPAQQNSARVRALLANASPIDPRRLSADLLDAATSNMLGRFIDAEQTVTRLQAIWRDPPASARAGMGEQLGLAQFRLGKIDEAEATYERTKTELRAVLGDDHHNMALLEGNLALIYIERGDFARAVSALERAMAIVRARATGSSLSLAWGLTNLANVYRFMGRPDDMLRTAEEARTRMAEALGPTHFSMAHSLAFVAYGLALRGDPGAEPIARQAVALQSALPADHYERAVGLTFLGFVLLQRGELAEAESVLTRALELRRARFPGANWRTAETAGFLGEVVARRGDRERAARLLDESVTIFTTLYGAENVRTLEARQRRDRSMGRPRLSE